MASVVMMVQVISQAAHGAIYSGRLGSLRPSGMIRVPEAGEETVAEVAGTLERICCLH
jgi:hypothetical protein